MTQAQLIHGDCLEIMPTLADGSVDMILADPPYGIDFKSNRTDHQRKIANDGMSDWLCFLPKWFDQMKRVISEDGVCCCCCCGGGKTPVTSMFTLEAIKHFNLIQTVVWRKFMGLGWRYRPAYENIVVLSKNKTKYNFFDTSKKCVNLIEGINQKIPRKGEHPTVKPVTLMEHFIKIHTQEGMTVLDPFMGSGTTGVACKNLGRNFIGIELDEKYFNIAKERINKTQQTLEFAKA